MISLALKGAGAALVAGTWIADSVGGLPDGVALALLPVGAALGYAAVRAGNGRQGERGG